MRALLIGPEERYAIARVAAHAFAHRYDRARLLDMRTVGSVGRDEVAPHLIVLPDGFGCVFTVEEQPTIGWCRHLAVGLLDGAADAGPHPFAVQQIAHAFGFRGDMADFHLFTVNEGTPDFAVNVLEPLA